MEKKWAPDARGFRVRFTGKILSHQVWGQIAKRVLESPSLGPCQRQRLLLGGEVEGGGRIKCSTAPRPALAPRTPGPALSWLQPACDQLCFLTSPKVPSKCQVEKLPVGESEAVCVLSDKWHGVKWAMILIASDSRHPLTPCSRMTLWGENQR